MRVFRSPIRHRLTGMLTALALTAGLSGAAVLPATDAVATESGGTVNGVRLNAHEKTLLDAINQARAAHGLPGLLVEPGTTDVARRWAWQMARAATLSHNPHLVAQISASGSPQWGWIAENVGFADARDPQALFDAYMNSPHHRDNILDSHVRFIGVGSVERPVNGALVAFNTLDFVDSYTGGYGPTRVPAAGMHLDQVPVTGDTTLATFESGRDQRWRSQFAGTLRMSAPSFDAPSARNGALRYALAAVRDGSGLADMVMYDAVDLHAASTLRLYASAVTPTGRPLTVRVYMNTPWVSSVYAGTVTLGSRAGWVSVPVPAAGRQFRSQIYLRVTSDALAQAVPQVADRKAYVNVYEVRAT